MWFEILPAFGIITAFVGIPSVGVYFLNKVVYGNAYRRDLRYRWDRFMYQRDDRITDGYPYKSTGLDGIPDEE